MNHRRQRLLTAGSMLLVGGLQAWDAGVVATGVWSCVLVSLAVLLLPAAELAGYGRRGYAVAALQAGVILVIVRWLAVPPLDELLLVPVFQGLLGSFGLHGGDTRLRPTRRGTMNLI